MGWLLVDRFNRLGGSKDRRRRRMVRASSHRAKGICPPTYPHSFPQVTSRVERRPADGGHVVRRAYRGDELGRDRAWGQLGSGSAALVSGGSDIGSAGSAGPGGSGCRPKPCRAFSSASSASRRRSACSLASASSCSRVRLRFTVSRVYSRPLGFRPQRPTRGQCVGGPPVRKRDRQSSEAARLVGCLPAEAPAPKVPEQREHDEYDHDNPDHIHETLPLRSMQRAFALTSAALVSLGNSSGWLRLGQSVSGVSRAIRAQIGVQSAGARSETLPRPEHESGQMGADWYRIPDSPRCGPHVPRWFRWANLTAVGRLGRPR